MRALMRDDILAAARQLLAENGVAGLSMRSLGRAVGVSAPTLYEYFPAKEDVLDALHAEGMDRLQATFARSIEKSRPGIEQLRTLAVEYRRFAIENPDLYLLLFARIDASYQQGADEIESCSSGFFTAVTAMEQAIAVGEVKPGDPIEYAYALWALAHGAITLEICGIAGGCGAKFQPEQFADLAALYERTIDLLLESIRA